MTASAFDDMVLNREIDVIKDLFPKMSDSILQLAQLCHELNVGRRCRIIDSYDQKTQIMMKKTEPGGFLFGSSLKALPESKKVLEKSA